MRVQHRQDFWAGLMFVAFGLGGLWFGSEYSFGQASRMGPGFFPTILSAGLVLLGAIILLRGVFAGGEFIAVPTLRPLVVVTAAVIAFSLLIGRFGLIPTIVVVAAISAFAPRDQVTWMEIAAIPIALAILNYLIFSVILRQPVPIWWG